MNDRFRFRVPLYKNGKFDSFAYTGVGEELFFVNMLLDVKPFEQCTGLKDKNGRLIYEGDIVKYTRTNWYCPGHPKHNQDLIYINEIFWDDKEFSFRKRGKFPGGNGNGWIGSICFQDSRADENIIEVIGNIHENASLLEEK